jgi:long-chain acyl-CoA synthetase
MRDKGQDPGNAMLLRNVLRRVKRQRLKDDLITEGQRRAKQFGWHNIYTYSKSMAEAVIAGMLPAERWSMFRPAIVESAAEYPFPGWNQGFNTCTPLIYLLGGWFRHLPARSATPSTSSRSTTSAAASSSPAPRCCSATTRRCTSAAARTGTC